MNDRPWLDFLDRIAIEKNLTASQVETLQAKFPKVNEEVNNTELAKQLFKDPAPRLRMLYKAFDCLQSDGKDQGKGKAITLRKYLNDRYNGEQEVLVRSIELPSSAELWSRLKGLGHHTRDRMGIRVKPMTLAKMGGVFKEKDSSSEFLDTVAKGTERLQFKIYKGRGKVVLLLNRDEAGDIWCICPSVRMPSFEFDREEMIVPQPESDDPYLLIPEDAGKEDWWAWIVSEEPRQLSWWDKAQNPDGYKLLPHDLLGLLQYVMKNQNGEVLHTYYRVV
jgi:hypothetical protein